MSDTKNVKLLEAKKKAGGLSSLDEQELVYLQETAQERSVELRRLRKLADVSVRNDRSQCLSCGHELAWYDLLPLASWISTKGKCRYCQKKIGTFEPLIEISTSALFTAFTYAWLTSVGTQAGDLLLLVLWLVALTMLVILFAYDLKWFLLPDKIMFPLIGLATIIAFGTMVVQGGVVVSQLISTGVSMLILGGLYFVLWFVSKGGWVGFGDVKLGIALGLLLMDWKLAFLTLFLANLIGTIIVLPGLITGKLSRKTQVPFGPFLIVGFLLSITIGHLIVDNFDRFSLWLSSTLLML